MAGDTVAPWELESLLSSMGFTKGNDNGNDNYDLKSRMDNLEQANEELKRKVQFNETEIGNTGSYIGDFSRRIDDAKEKAEESYRLATENQSSLSDFNVNLGNVETKTMSNESSIGGIETRTANNENKGIELDGGIQSLANEIGIVDGKVVGVESRTVDVESKSEVNGAENDRQDNEIGGIRGEFERINTELSGKASTTALSDATAGLITRIQANADNSYSKATTYTNNMLKTVPNEGTMYEGYSMQTMMTNLTRMLNQGVGIRTLTIGAKNAARMSFTMDNTHDGLDIIRINTKNSAGADKWRAFAFNVKDSSFAATGPIFAQGLNVPANIRALIARTDELMANAPTDLNFNTTLKKFIMPVMKELPGFNWLQTTSKSFAGAGYSISNMTIHLDRIKDKIDTMNAEINSMKGKQDIFIADIARMQTKRHGSHTFEQLMASLARDGIWAPSEFKSFAAFMRYMNSVMFSGTTTIMGEFKTMEDKIRIMGDELKVNMDFLGKAFCLAKGFPQYIEAYW